MLGIQQFNPSKTNKKLFICTDSSIKIISEACRKTIYLNNATEPHMLCFLLMNYLFKTPINQVASTHEK